MLRLARRQRLALLPMIARWKTCFWSAEGVNLFWREAYALVERDRLNDN
jgi:hypothetical protein